MGTLADGTYLAMLAPLLLPPLLLQVGPKSDIAARTGPVYLRWPPSLAASAVCYLKRTHVYFDTLLLLLPLTIHRDITSGELLRQLLYLALVVANRLPRHLPSLSFTRLANRQPLTTR
jgi:hypothetical protein